MMAITPEQLERARKIRAALDKAISNIVSIAPDDADAVIHVMDGVREWKPGIYAVDDVRKCNGKMYKCFQAHDSTENVDWDPEKSPALWIPLHGKTRETALPWQAPTGSHDLYKEGEFMIWTDGTVKKCNQNTNFSPDEYPGAWE